MRALLEEGGEEFLLGLHDCGEALGFDGWMLMVWDRLGKGCLLWTKIDGKPPAVSFVAPRSRTSTMSSRVYRRPPASGNLSETRKRAFFD